jgi:hypothetical protein
MVQAGRSSAPTGPPPRSTARDLQRLEADGEEAPRAARARRRTEGCASSRPGLETAIGRRRPGYPAQMHAARRYVFTNDSGFIVRRRSIPPPPMNMQVRGGMPVSARWPTPGTSPRIHHAPDVDRQRSSVSAGQRPGDANRMKRRIPVVTHTPRGYDEGPPTGKRPGQRPFSLCGRCRIRTCVGIRRRIYRTTMPTP